MLKISKTLWLLISTSLVISACSSGNNIQQLPGGTLENTNWELKSIPDGLPTGVDINLTFEQDKVNGKAVCNRYFASYSSKKNKISFKEVGATRMMCPEHSKVEMAYFDLLSQAQTYGIEKDVLTIKTSQGDLVFHKAEIKENTSINTDSFQGFFATSGYPDAYFQSLNIVKENKIYTVSFSASKVNGDAACSFYGSGQLHNGLLRIAIEKEGKIVYLVIKPGENGMEVSTEDFENRFALMQYCSGGASLMGLYLPETQPSPSMKLEENGLGELDQNLSAKEIEENLSQLFPQKNIQRKMAQREDGNYAYYAVGNNQKEDMQVNITEGNRIHSIYLNSPIMSDAYGIEVGFPFHLLKTKLPLLQLKTDAHFHTYAQLPNSKIKYELCCNTNLLDKENWTSEEVKDWKVKSIIWEAS